MSAEKKVRKKVGKKVGKKVEKKAMNTSFLPLTELDFKLIAHIVNIPEGKKTFKWGDEHTLIAIYLNIYGVEIGGLCRNIKSGRIISMEACMYKDFLAGGGIFCS